MNAKKTTVRVTIMGQEFNLRSDVSPERTMEVAEYLDQAIRSVMGSGTVVETSKAAILAALQITAELFKAREASEQLTTEMRALSGDLRRLIPPAKREELAREGVPGVES